VRPGIAGRRLARNRRTIKLISPDGAERVFEYVHEKHPVSAAEVRGWLEKHGFEIERFFGDRAGRPYTDDSSRAIFRARKMHGDV